MEKNLLTTHTNAMTSDEVEGIQETPTATEKAVTETVSQDLITITESELSQTTQQAPPDIRLIKMNQIELSTSNARRNPTLDLKLRDSIEFIGLQQPIIVRYSKEKKKYVVVVGARRFLCCESLGWDEIKSEVIECDDETAELISLAENMVRENLTKREIVEKIVELVRTGTQGSIRFLAKAIGVSEGYIRKVMKIKNLPPDIKEKIANKEISQQAALEMVYPSTKKSTEKLNNTSDLEEKSDDTKPSGSNVFAFPTQSESRVSSEFPSISVAELPAPSVKDVCQPIEDAIDLPEKAKTDDFPKLMSLLTDLRHACPVPERLATWNSVRLKNLKTSVVEVMEKLEKVHKNIEALENDSSEEQMDLTA